MEYFDLRNPDGSVTGEIKERSAVHRDGDLHGASHVWIARKHPETGKIELLLQKRSENKDSYPGCLDISAAGHLGAGDEYLPCAIRELEEELGIRADAKDLQFLFMYHCDVEEVFHGSLFKNREISAVYLYSKPVEADKLMLQREEVESVCWVDLEECRRQVKAGNPAYCLLEDELEQLKVQLSDF